MAIQKINLGTEPLGEGGDTYRSANTKINENFSNTAHAASRLVGESSGNVLEYKSRSAGGFTSLYSTGEVSEIYKKGTISNWASHSSISANSEGVSNLRMGTAGVSIIAVSHSEGTGQLNNHRSTTNRLLMQNGILGIQGIGDTEDKWGIAHLVYTTGNTTKDSKTNLLLASGDSIPSNSAASRLVGTEWGDVLAVGSGGLETLSFADRKAYGTEQQYFADMHNLPNLKRTLLSNAGAWGYPAGVHFRVKDNVSFGLFYSNFGGGSGNTSVRLALKSGDTTSSGLILASGINAFADSNGFWKTSSPVVRVYANEIDPNDDAEKQGVTFTRNGVGDYTLHNTLGLAQTGWTITLPEDNNRNPLVAIETEELENGDLNIRTYRRIFSMETFTFTCDYDNPLDIPEGRCVDVRLHEIIPEVTEPEPEVEPEVEEEPTEEPSEEFK